MLDFENALLTWIEESKDDLVRFLRELVTAKSENPPGDERRVAELVRREMRRFGFGEPECHMLDEKRPNLIYRLKGNDPHGLTTAFNAHMDTKPAGEPAQWPADPFAGDIRDGKMAGLGTCDMKGALAAMVFAFAAVRRLGADTPGTLELVLTADEEAGSKYGAAYIARLGVLNADYVVLGEPSGVRSDWETICIVSRGISCFKIKVFGDQMHSSLTDRLGTVNASEKMAHILASFKRRLRLRYKPHPYCPEGPTVNPGVMVGGGVFYGVNPGYAEFHCDIRTIPGMTREGLIRDVRECLDEMMSEDPGLRAELEMASPPLDWVEPTEIDPASPPVEAIRSACRKVLGRVPPLGAFPGGTDASFFQGIGGIPTVPSFGPGLLTVAHSPKEFVSLSSVVEAAKLYALVAWDMARRTRKEVW